MFDKKVNCMEALSSIEGKTVEQLWDSLQKNSASARIKEYTAHSLIPIGFEGSRFSLSELMEDVEESEYILQFIEGYNQRFPTYDNVPEHTKNCEKFCRSYIQNNLNGNKGFVVVDGSLYCKLSYIFSAFGIDFIRERINYSSVPVVVASNEVQGYIVKILTESIHQHYVSFTLPAIPGIISALSGYSSCHISLPATKLAKTRNDIATIDASTQEVVVTIDNPFAFNNAIKNNIFLSDIIYELLPIKH
jgi:hypothetical protein